MTRFAKSNEIVRLIAAAFGEREDVVYLLSGRKIALLLALLAQWVCFDATVADTLLRTNVSLVGSRGKRMDT